MGTAGGHLTVLDCEQILVGLARGVTLTAIARSLGRAVSTVSREVKRGGGRDGYSAWRAHEDAREQARRPKPFKLDGGRLLQAVTAELEKLWSPQEIAARLRLEHPDDPEMHVSHETIYQPLFVQGRGQLRRALARCLRSGRATRKSRTPTDRRGRLPGMVMISERPAEVEDRAVPGHWEGDVVLGATSRSAVGTLVERPTRLTSLLHLPDGKSAAQVEAAMRGAITELPASLARTITWDRGAEAAWGGFQHHSTWTITDLQPPRLLRYVFTFTDADGNHLTPAEAGIPPGVPDEGQHMVELTSTPDGGTRLRMTESGYATAEARDLTASGLENCWTRWRRMWRAGSDKAGVPTRLSFATEVTRLTAGSSALVEHWRDSGRAPRCDASGAWIRASGNRGKVRREHGDHH